jgi:DNA-binding HxlR family transcriptional regulator
VRGYGEYCPIALGAEVFAERWTPIIIRNLLVGADRFNDILDGAPGLPRSVLSQRLRTLERVGVVVRHAEGRRTRYRLTASGHELASVAMALGVWGARWRELQPEHHDPYLALWTLSKLIDRDGLPRARIVVRFELPKERAHGRFWLVLSRAGNEVCVTDPGFEENGIVTTDAECLVRWHCGRVTLRQAIEGGRMDVEAPPWLTRQLVAWGALSPFSDISTALGPPGNGIDPGLEPVPPADDGSPRLPAGTAIRA